MDDYDAQEDGFSLTRDQIASGVSHTGNIFGNLTSNGVMTLSTIDSSRLGATDYFADPNNWQTPVKKANMTNWLPNAVWQQALMQISYRYLPRLFNCNALENAGKNKTVSLQAIDRDGRHSNIMRQQIVFVTAGLIYTDLCPMSVRDIDVSSSTHLGVAVSNETTFSIDAASYFVATNDD